MKSDPKGFEECALFVGDAVRYRHQTPLWPDNELPQPTVSRAMAGESQLEAQIESPPDALFAMEARNRRLDRHPFASARPRFDHPTELMARDHALGRDRCLANPTLLEPMGIGPTQANAEHPDQDVADVWLSHRDLDMLEPTNIHESNSWRVLDDHRGVIVPPRA